MPLLLVLRYRAGTARRLGRKWIATVNLVSLIVSAGLFIWVGAVTAFWVPQALLYSFAGLMVGGVLGLLGLALTRWERTPHATHYTPNRWLVLVITLAVTARLLYGLWRIWHAWRASGANDSWIAAAGGGRFHGDRSGSARILSHLFSWHPLAPQKHLTTERSSACASHTWIAIIHRRCSQSAGYSKTVAEEVPKHVPPRGARAVNSAHKLRRGRCRWFRSRRGRWRCRAQGLWRRKT